MHSLNEQQLKAVKKTEGPLLVLAGAGSGKTKVLTTRIAYLISKKNIEPENIVAITFTNKAAKEMKERVVKLIGPNAYRMQLSTFHSFGLKILKENYSLIGYQKNFTILDSDDSLILVRKIIKEMNLDTKTYDPKNIRNKISGYKNELILENECDELTEDNKIIKIYKKYQEKLFISNTLDFDDLLIKPIELFTKNPQVLKAYQEKFKYILVDEYQDTNNAQYILIKLLAAKYKNICVVGDNDQSIYSFRGANYKNILNFEKDYKNTEVIMLKQNYRSTKNILNAANAVIKNNKFRKDKKLFTDNEEGSDIIYKRCSDQSDEARYIVSKIDKDYNETAILYRTNAQSRSIEDALLRKNIPYKIIGGFSFYKRKEIKDLLGYLFLIYNTQDDISLLRTINTPKRGIGQMTLEKLTLDANKQNKSIFEIISSGKEEKFKKIIIDMIEKSKTLELTELIDYIIDKSGFKEQYENEKTLEAEVRLENLYEFKSIAYSYLKENENPSLGDFLSGLSLSSDTDDLNDDNKVTLMTIHAAKGLEFNNVFIAGLEEGIFPHNNSLGSPSDLEEERRLCYVAITRAKKNLYILNTKKRLLFGMENYNPVSRFISEIGLEEEKEIKTFYKHDELNNDTYSTGEKINHDKFGYGIIVSIDGEIITVAFSEQYGIKKLLAGHKSIHKI